MTRVGADATPSAPLLSPARPLAPTRGARSIDEKVEYATDYVGTTTKLVGIGVLIYLGIAYVLPNLLGAYGKTKSAWKTL